MRREETIRALAADDTNDKATVRIAADRLGLSPAQIYRLISKFREAPVTASLVVMKPGPKKGARLLPGPIECRIDDAIAMIFKTRERPTVAKLQRDLWNAGYRALI